MNIWECITQICAKCSFWQSRKGFSLCQSECSRNNQVWFCLPYATHKFGFVWVHRKHLHWNKAGLRGHHHEPCRQAMPWSGMVLQNVETYLQPHFSHIHLLDYWYYVAFILFILFFRYQNISGGDISQVHLESGVHGAVATQSRPGNSGIPGIRCPRLQDHEAPIFGSLPATNGFLWDRALQKIQGRSMSQSEFSIFEWSFGGYTRYTVYTPGFRPRREDSGSKKVSIFWHLNHRPNVNHVEMESTPAWKYG